MYKLQIKESKMIMLWVFVNLIIKSNKVHKNQNMSFKPLNKVADMKDINLGI